MAHTGGKAEEIFKKRRKRLIKALGASLCLIPAAPQRHYSRDQHYPYRQDSHFFYLTGIKEDNAALVLFGDKKPKSILYLEDSDPERAVWEGDRLGLRKARRRIAVDDVRPFSDLTKDFEKLCSGCEAIHYALGTHPTCDDLVRTVLSVPTRPRFNMPHSLIDSTELLSEMRLYKDKNEISLLRRASEITARGLLEIAPMLREMKNEKQCALQLESIFAKYGAEGSSFATIVAAGKNACTLHHSPSFSPLWKRDLVLIDCGASFNGYAGDITRVFPVSGAFSAPQAAVYDAVREAVAVGIQAAKPGESLDDIHQHVSHSIATSLIQMGILHGAPKQLQFKGEHTKYFMHRTGHWLGLDVHDTAPTQLLSRRAPSHLIPLEPGMAFTIEPGLYFGAQDTSVPKEFRGIGIRLEEDILITTKGAEVMSSAVPIDREVIEKMCG